MADNKKIITCVRQWLESIVIELNLCPFAEQVYVNEGVRFILSDAETEADLLISLHDEIVHLKENTNIATTLLIHPSVLVDFHKYNQFLDIAENLLEEYDWQGDFQIASFHPNYQFANTQPNDPENYTNRSPYPVLHILRESMVEQAVESYPDIEQIPQRNIRQMKEIGSSRLESQLNVSRGLQNK